jgi:ClpA/ClpB-like protein
VRLGVANLDTEHMLLGLPGQEGLAAQVLRERSVTVESVREQLENSVPSGPAQKRKMTACKDCRHLILDGEPNHLRLNLFCAASSIEPAFDCFTGEFQQRAADRPGDRYQTCITVNFGECSLFEPKESPEQRGAHEYRRTLEFYD